MISLWPAEHRTDTDLIRRRDWRQAQPLKFAGDSPKDGFEGAAGSDAQLFRAIRRKDKDTVRRLHRDGVNLAIRHPKTQHTLLTDAASRGDIDMLALLLDLNLDVNEPGAEHRPPVMHAVKGGHLHALGYLAGRNADLQYRDEQDETPFTLACDQQQFEIALDFLDRHEHAKSLQIGEMEWEKALAHLEALRQNNKDVDLKAIEVLEYRIKFLRKSLRA